MERIAVGMLLATALLAGQEAAPGIVRGTLSRAEGGILEIQRLGEAPVRCTFDSHTWIERDKKRLQLDSLEAGLPVEALTDLRAGRCYTRTLRLVPAATMARVTPVARRTMPNLQSLVDSIHPRGNLTFGAVVIRRSPTLLVVRTRTEPEKILRLRDDTRFLYSGSPAAAEDVPVNARVFIRAGKNFENDVEAYQVIWGEIAGPKTTGWQ
jgi:hypothetical protein